MESFSLFEWILNNKEWVLSGIGVLILNLVFQILKKNKPNVNQKARGQSIQVGGNVSGNINLFLKKEGTKYTDSQKKFTFRLVILGITIFMIETAVGAFILSKTIFKNSLNDQYEKKWCIFDESSKKLKNKINGFNTNNLETDNYPNSDITTKKQQFNKDKIESVTHFYSISKRNNSVTKRKKSLGSKYDANNNRFCVIITNDILVKDEPFENAKTIINFDETFFGKSFYILSEQNSFFKIKVKSIKGWIKGTTGKTILANNQKKYLYAEANCCYFYALNNSNNSKNLFEIDVYPTFSLQGYPITWVRLNDLKYVFYETEKSILLGKEPYFHKSNSDAILIGWVDKNLFFKSNNRIGIEFSKKNFNSRKNNLAKVYNSETDLINSFEGDNPKPVYIERNSNTPMNYYESRFPVIEEKIYNEKEYYKIILLDYYLKKNNTISDSTAENKNSFTVENEEDKIVDIKKSIDQKEIDTEIFQSIRFCTIGYVSKYNDKGINQVNETVLTNKIDIEMLKSNLFNFLCDIKYWDSTYKNTANLKTEFEFIKYKLLRILTGYKIQKKETLQNYIERQNIFISTELLDLSFNTLLNKIKNSKTEKLNLIKYINKKLLKLEEVCHEKKLFDIEWDDEDFTFMFRVSNIEQLYFFYEDQLNCLFYCPKKVQKNDAVVIKRYPTYAWLPISFLP